MFSSIPNGTMPVLTTHPQTDNICAIIARIPDIVSDFKEGVSIENLCNKYGGDRLVIEEIIRLGIRCNIKK